MLSRGLAIERETVCFADCLASSSDSALKAMYPMKIATHMRDTGENIMRSNPMKISTITSSVLPELSAVVAAAPSTILRRYRKGVPGVPVLCRYVSRVVNAPSTNKTHFTTNLWA